MENRTTFGMHAADYRRYRPRYPAEFFQCLATLCREHERALDCATGNGQAAVSLVDHFDRVMAFDASTRQIAEALEHERVEYFVASAETLPADIGPFDLVTVAQGAHWFDLPLFYAALRPLLKPGAVVAIWGYSHCRVAPQIDLAMMETLLLPIAPFWADGNRIITERYESIEFPFVALETPAFAMREQWDRAALFGYIRTWSAYKRFVAERGSDPLGAFERTLDREALWPEAQARTVVFDIYARVGRHVE